MTRIRDIGSCVARRLRASRTLRYLLRGVFLLAVLWVLNAPLQVWVVLGPQRHVETINPCIGIHTRLTDEVEEWKIKRTFEMVREMGSPWVVDYFPWAYYEPRKGYYRWQHADLVADHAARQGLTLIARIDFVPPWARPEDTTYRHLDRAHFSDYADFVRAFAEHFAGRIDHIIVWNEPNLSFEWGYRLPDPQAYTDLLCQAYRAAKEGNPRIEVLGAGLAPTLAPPGDEWGMNDLYFLERMYEYGAGDCFDGLAVHAYGLTFPPDDPANPNVLNFARVELIHGLMVQYGDGEKPCYVTEGGWNDHPRWTKAVRPYQRIAYTVRAYEKAEAEWPWCRAVCLWAFRYPCSQNTYQDYFTFVTPDFIPKPVYIEVEHYAHDEPFEYLEP
ncbi:MAG: hypothetical protein U9R48_00645 [Chloroflexota bacterium]|nr:hypothetical protein [Chloroflexota bacterium]